MSTTISPHDLHQLLRAEHDDPFVTLGALISLLIILSNACVVMR